MCYEGSRRRRATPGENANPDGSIREVITQAEVVGGISGGPELCIAHQFLETIYDRGTGSIGSAQYVEMRCVAVMIDVETHVDITAGHRGFRNCARRGQRRVEK